MLSKRAVEQYDANTGALIKRHESVYAAANAHDASPGARATLMTAIVNCCKGRQKTAYGFKWKYAKNDFC